MWKEEKNNEFVKKLIPIAYFYLLGDVDLFFKSLSADFVNDISSYYIR